MKQALPYNRALHTDDYPGLRPWADTVLAFEQRLRSEGIPFRKDHAHRTWEYANVLRQIDELFAGQRPLRILDVGAGGSSLAPMLATQGHEVVIVDSMAYGDIVEAFTWPQAQRLKLHPLNMLVVAEPAEAMPSIISDSQDVTCCISVIEHVAPGAYESALRELVRVTRPGGYLFLTSDYFENMDQWEASPYKSIQHTAFTAPLVEAILSIIPVTFVGGVDLRWRGDFVHNYSFVNMVFRKPD